MSRLIVLTGLDGSGTTSVAERLHELDKGSKIFSGIESPFNDHRDSIDHETRTRSCIAHYFYYLAANIYSSSMIENALEFGNVYCVRYLIDTVVSHRVAGLNVDLTYDNGFYQIHKPDLIVFLSVEEWKRQERLKKRGKSYLDNTLDDDDFRKRFLEEFEKLSDHYVSVDTTNKSILQIAELINSFFDDMKEV